jgi:hypothetical protein
VNPERGIARWAAMETVAEWVAPAATMIAATIVALNLGARITGWGFVIFTVGSLAWIVMALASGQQGLLVTNILLTVINLIGIWRWLGREAKLADGAAEAADASIATPDADLAPLAMLADCPVHDQAGNRIACAAGGMVDRGHGCHPLSCRARRRGRRCGRAFPRALRGMACGSRATGSWHPMTAVALRKLPEIDPACWPASTRGQCGPPRVRQPEPFPTARPATR